MKLLHRLIKESVSLNGLGVVVGATLMLAGSNSHAQSSAVDVTSPASMKHPLVPSHGSNLLGVLYLAAGREPHPTAILFHGLPGYEQNLDLAQELRRAGWNVLAVHYRGSWGVAGIFSFMHCVEDADSEVSFVLDPKNIAQYHIDSSRVVVIGHSMGGFIAASAAAHNKNVKAVVLLSAWNIGAPRPSEVDEAKAFASGENLAPIAGTDGATLADEEFTHRAELDMLHLASAIAPRPVMVVTANDGSDQFATPFVAALRTAGATHVSTSHFATDHVYSPERQELATAVLAFLKDS